LTKDLYTVTDVKTVREELLTEQEGYDKLTLTKILPKQACLDHSHDTLLVRAVLNRQTNAALGKLEGVYTRYLRHWYEGSLSNFLRQAAAYIEGKDDSRWRHPHWIKKVKTSFNKLNEAQKSRVLIGLGYEDGANSKARKEIFAKVVLDRELGYEVINNKIKDINAT
jgi:hypothetical protein